MTALQEAPKYFIKDNIHVINVGYGPQGYIFAKMMLSLRQLRKHPYDLVHATSWRVAVPYILSGGHSPLVVSAHGRELFIVPQTLTPIMAMVLSKAHAVVAVSNPILQSLQDVLPVALKRSGVAWNGISYPQEARDHVIKQKSNRIFCLCRLVERKNIVASVKALKTLVGEGVSFSFYIAGSGPEATAIRDAIRKHSLENHVQLLGKISDEEAIQYYSSCGIFLHPQISTKGGRDLEGFGISIADAMSFGAAVVAGASGGPLDYIRDGETGILVDGNNIDSISSALRNLLLDTRLRQDLSVQAKRFALSELTWDRHVETILRIAEISY